ncbi:MAG: 4-hydroxy-3-methylbut-2-enyl diphosphate reductase [Lachnospiraceae bacterium]|nr:4-hydroxy-3-methylbut-2-enyl diphosphate reductase [Lachnospiraceae bacterium]
MEVKLAKSAGFCFGVKRAVDTVYEQVGTGKKIYTLGPITHNEEVVRDLEEKGVQVLESEEELLNLQDGTVIIRSHGVAKHVYDTLKQQNLEHVDATCPFVRKIHKIVEEESSKGNTILIIGNETHPEVEGIRGWSKSEAYVVNTVEEAQNFDVFIEKKLCIVSQTTFNYNKFQELVEIISKKGYDIIVLNTICNATEVRQQEARKIAKDVDAMIVIGGKHSSNTQKLFEICKNECENTYYIQTLVDLDFDRLKTVGSVGITAGASTPKNIIEEVQFKCQN